MTKQAYFLIVLISFVAAALCKVKAQDSTHHSNPTFFNYLSELNEGVLDLTIESNFNKFIASKFKEEYQGASLTLNGNEGQTLSIESKIKARGNSRKQICHLPPIKLKISKKTLEGLDLDTTFNKYKLVVQCKKASLYNDYVLKEYTAYKLFELMYPYSFKVKLARITYKNKKKNGKISEYQQYGFFIENEEELAARLEARNVERSKSGFNQVDREACLKMSLLQYMIGNTDWAFPNLHNLKLIKVPSCIKPVPIPYDFDYSGLVDAEYAVVHHTINLKDVTERLYRGPMMKKGEVKVLVKEFLEKKEEAIAIAESSKGLSDRQRKEMTRYIYSFFEQLENESYMIRMLTN